MDPTNPSAAGTASGGAILPTCSTISSASSQMHQHHHHPNPAATPFGAIGGAASGHGATGSGSGGGVGEHASSLLSPTLLSPGTNTGTASIATSRDEEDDSSNQASSGSKGSGQRRAAYRSSPPKVHTSLVSRTNSEDDGYRRAGYQSTQQSSTTSRTGLVRRTTVPGHYQSIDRSHSFNEHDHDAMSRWYQYHQQRHPLSRNGSRTGSVPRSQRRRYSLRDNDDDGSMPTGLNRMVSFDSVGGQSSCSGLLTRHRVSHPSVASSSFDQFDQSSYHSQQQQQHQQQEQQDELSSSQQQLQQQQLSQSLSNGTTRGAQSWKNLRAVMAYYCSLRKIKRNGAKC
uniref:Uncharacterized protein n=1 Tax=Anopheles melas TaxID=34690 RepID=A0A182U3P0_9DIPT